MRILITGATGSMAYYLSQYIRRDGGTVIFGLGTRACTDDINPWVDRYERIDLSTALTDRIAEFILEAKPDIIFHLAAMANVRLSFSDPERFAANNIRGTIKLLEAIARSNLKPRFVLASTSEVYGDVPKILNPIQETLPFRPMNPYAVTKCDQENWAQYYSTAYNFPLVITRAFGYINPRREDLVATVIARQLIQCERGEKDTIWHGDLSPVRSFCDVRDIAEAYWLAATQVPAGIYNIGSDTGCSIKNLAEILKSLTPAKPTWIRDAQLTRRTDVFHAVPDIFKFRRVSRWSPKISLHESLIWLMEEMRNKTPEAR